MSEPIKEEEEIAETDNTENPELNEVCWEAFCYLRILRCIKLIKYFLLIV